jgi:hypothetical protein
MEEKDFNESNEETCARGVKRNSENKIVEVSSSKKKRAKKRRRRREEEKHDEEKQSEESAKRSRMFEAVKDVAEGKISIEELTVALNNAVTRRNIRPGCQGALYNPPEEPATIELDMAAFNRSAMAIARNRERIATLIRNARPLPSSNINPVVQRSWCEKRGLRLDRQDRVSDGQKARIGWLRLYAYSRWKLDVYNPRFLEY